MEMRCRDERLTFSGSEQNSREWFGRRERVDRNNKEQEGGIGSKRVRHYEAARAARNRTQLKVRQPQCKAAKSNKEQSGTGTSRVTG